MIKVLLADDHAMMRGGLKRIIADSSGIEVCGEAASGEEVLDQLKRIDCHVLIMDMTMPPPAGIDLILDVKKKYPKLPIMVLSMHNTGKIASAALQAGASGYLAKDSYPDKLADIIKTIADGGRFIDPVIAHRIAFDSTSPPKAYDDLSEREKQVLTKIVAGDSLNQIAEDLFISPKTVSTHKKRIMDKLGISNNAGLIRFAAKFLPNQHSM